MRPVGLPFLVGSSITILSIFCRIKRYELTLHMMSTCFDLIASYYKELLTTITDLALSLMINYSYYVTAVVEVEQITYYDSRLSQLVLLLSFKVL